MTPKHYGVTIIVSFVLITIINYLISWWLFFFFPDAQMSFHVNVTDILADRLHLEFSPNSIHCYELSCIIRHVNSGFERELNISASDKSVVVPDLDQNTEYQVVCTATRLTNTITRQFRVFAAG